MSKDIAGPTATPEVLALDWGDLAHALRAGWRDFLAEPTYGAFFSLVYVACGWLLVFAFTIKGQLWWTLPASAGFPILGPFIACGFYEISRRRESGTPLVLRDILLTVLRQKDRQIPSMAAVIVVFFLFWNFLSHMIFALFLGKATLTNITSSLAVFLTPEGLAMLVVGLVISLFQALTQINEATLSFVPKLIAAIAVFAIAGPWMLTTMVEFIRTTILSIPQYAV